MECSEKITSKLLVYFHYNTKLLSAESTLWDLKHASVVF